MHGEHDADRGELDEGQHGSRRQVQQLGGLPVDLHLQGGVRRSAEDLDDTEGGEGEEEDHQGRRRQGGRERGQRDASPGGEASGAQYPRGLLLPRVELCPQPAHRAYDDGVVEEDVREEDGPHGGVQPDAPQFVEEPAATEQREERGADDDGRQHERHRDRRSQRPLAGEVEPREDIRAGQRDQQRERGGRQRLPGGEPEHALHVGAAEHLTDPPELPDTLDLQAASDDGDDGVGEEEREERDGHGHQAEPRRAPAQRGPAGPRPAVRCPAVGLRYFTTSEDHD